MAASELRRAVLYGRVSKARGRKVAGQHQPAEGKSVDQQLDRLTELAARDNVAIVGVHRDDGISASRYANGQEREGWREVMTAIMGRRANELWAWEISRATRDRPVWATLVNTCILNGAKITLDGKVHDPTDPDDGFMLDLMAALAVRESAVTSKRILRDVAARAAAGKPHGKLPYGYRREYDPTTGELQRQVPDEDVAPVVREIARRLLNEEALYAVANDLTRRGVPAPRGAPAWTPSHVRRIAMNPTYAGMRTHNGEVVGPADWEGLISETDHRILRAKFADPARRTWRDGAAKHLLAGLAECGVCGAPCRRVKNRGTPSYSCGGKGFHVSRVQRDLDVYVSEYVIARFSQPDLIERLAPAGDDAATEAAEQLRGLRVRLEEFQTAAAKGQISAGSFARIEAKLLVEIKEAERRAVPRGMPAVVTMLTGADVAGRWGELTVIQRRQVIRALMTVRILPAGKGTRSFNPNSVEIIWRGTP